MRRLDVEVVRLLLLALLLPLALLSSSQSASPTIVHADGETRVTSYFCPPNCGQAYWTGQTPIPGFTAGCAKAHAFQYAHLTNIGLTVYCEDYGASWYLEDGSEPVDVYGIYLGEDYDYVWYSDSP